jgi:hypothetical protein
MLFLIFVCLILAGIYFISINEDLIAKNDSLNFEWLIEPTLWGATPFHSGYAWIQREKDAAWSLIDLKGNVIARDFQADHINSLSFRDVTSPDFDVFRARVKGNFYSGYVNHSGDVVIPPVYQMGRFFTEGLAAVKRGDFWGVIDQKGTVVIPFIYEDLTFFRQGLIAAKKDGKWGYIDRRGQTCIDFVFDNVGRGHYGEGLYPVAVNGKEGLLDSEGNWVLDTIYEKIYPGSEELIGVQRNGKVGFVDRDGRVVIDFQYEGIPWGALDPRKIYIPLLQYIYNFSEGLAVVWLSGGYEDPGRASFGVINQKGELLFNLSGWPRGYYSEGFLLVIRYSDRDLGLVDKTGKWHSLPSSLSRKGVYAGFVSDGNLVIRTPVKFGDDQSGKYGYLKIGRK